MYPTPSRSPRHLPALRLSAACAAVTTLLCPAVRADDLATQAPANPYTLGVLETYAHDSNVFRAPSGPEALPDWISTTGVFASVDKAYGRERLIASGELDYNKFRHQTQLDSTAHTLSIEGDWATIDRLSGEVGYSDSSQLYRYSLNNVQTLTAKNTLGTHSGFARFHLGVVTRLTFDATLESYQQDYSAQVYKYRELKRHDGSLGVTYQTSSELRTSLSYRRTIGDYPNYTQGVDATGQPVTVPDHFHRGDVILGAVYTPSGASQLHVQVSRADEHHSVLTNRSFNSWTLNGGWTWLATGRTTLALNFVRDDDTGTEDIGLLGLPVATNDATKRTAVTGKLTYNATAKIQLVGSGTFARRLLDTAFSQAPGANASVTGSDKLYQASLGFNYVPTRSIQLGCSGAREQRSVQGQSITVVTYPYRDTLWSCTGQFAFN